MSLLTKYQLPITVKELDRDLKNVTSNVKRLEKDIASQRLDIEDLDKISVYSNSVVADKLQGVKDKVEPVVNEALKLVFLEDDLYFEFRTKIAYDKTQYYPVIGNRKNGSEGGVNEHGGGVITLASVILRMVFIILQDKPRLLVLDESLNPVSPAYRPKVSGFLSRICKELDFTLVLITFDEYNGFSNSADVVYEAKQGKFKTTKFEKVK